MLGSAIRTCTDLQLPGSQLQSCSKHISELGQDRYFKYLKWDNLACRISFVTQRLVDVERRLRVAAEQEAEKAKAEVKALQIRLAALGQESGT